MKRSVKALTFAAAAAAGLTISGCWNLPVGVYGPPPETSSQPATQQTETKKTDATLPSEYDPTREQEVDVYGPPPEKDPA